MSASPPPAKPPKAAAPPVETLRATAAGRKPASRSIAAIVAMSVGGLVIVAALAFAVIAREPEVEVEDLATAFACPPGVESRSGRMHVSASTLNVRAAPHAKAERLPDRTLRKSAAVTEECRSGSWSRVRLVDGRSGWVANQYLKPIAGS